MTRRATPGAQPLRIAMVAACPFPSPRGSQVLIRELAEALADQGHEVHLVAYPHGENLVPIHGIFVHRVRPPRFVALPPGLSWQKIVLDACMAWTLYRVVRTERIQVIHAHNYEGPLISYPVRRLTGVPVVYHSHNALSDELACYFKPGWRRSVVRRAGEILDRQVPRRADFSIALTPELEGFLRAHDVPESRVATVPPGLAAAAFAEAEATDRRRFAGRFVVMYSGNLDPYQDLDVLLEGFDRFHAQVSNALLVMVTHEQRWQERLGGRLEVLMRTDAARVIVAPAFALARRLLARADVLVCPRSSWSGFPIKLINYMAMGRPLVAAEGSAKGVIDGETGLVFRNRDSRDLAAALRRLFDDPTLAQRLGENAHAAASLSYSWNRVLPRIVRIYEQVCARPVTARPEAPSVATATSRGLMAVPRGRISAAARDRSG